MPDPDAARPADTSDPAAHEGEIDIGKPMAAGAPEALGKLVARFVRYPGCQQLTLWLPQAGYMGYTNVSITHLDGIGKGAGIGTGIGACIDQARVVDRLSGSVQMLWDTLAWPPGAYRVEIAHADGWCHRLELYKRRPDELVPVLVDDSPVPRDTDADKLLRSPSGEIIYRDGFGRAMPDLDLQMRAKASEALARQLLGQGLAPRSPHNLKPAADRARRAGRRRAG